MTPIDPAQLADLRSRHRSRHEQLIEAFRERPDPDRLLRGLSQLTDSTVRAVWALAAPPRGATLAAVGGYGRAEMFPHSDVDLLVLLERAPDEAMRVSLEAFVGACWDVGLQIGHSVRTGDECVREAAGDITVQTSAMEARLLAGSRKLFKRTLERLRAQIDPQAFFRAKWLEMRQRHVKFEDTPYSLEPNTKESPGGLRDLQVVMWTARAAGLGWRWAELARGGLATPAELRAVRASERMIRRIRACLHILAGRREDRLVFDLQAQVAEFLGLSGDSARRASEAVMQRYFWAAKQVTQMSTILLQNLETELFSQRDIAPEPIDDEFQDRNGLLDAIDPTIFERDPAAILRAFICLARHTELSGFSVATLREIWHARMRLDASFRAQPENRHLFMSLLQQPRGVTRTLRRMNQWSVLGRYLPPFRRIIGRMQHDLFHVYTVDQHILMVVRNLRRFAMAEHAHEYPFCSQLMANFPRQWRLYVAALFHDIAKGRGGDHSQLGKADARRFCRQHGVTRQDTALIVFLVEHHLTMSQIAQKQDLADPEVTERFARLVGTEERLTALYLLTVADIRGTSPKVWNAWKGKLLHDLYQLTRRALDGSAPRPADQLDELRREARRLLNLHAVAESDYARLWAQLDVGYFLRTDANDVAWQTRALHAHVDSQVPVVRARLAPIGEGFQIVVYMPDQPALFARICNYFDRKNLSVLDARIHTTRHGYALDSFLVVAPQADLHYRDILSLVEVELTEQLKRQDPLSPPVHGRMSRRSRYFPIEPKIELRPDERGQHHLLSVVANDRTGLLYGIARVLSEHQVNLYTARISTLGERVEDLFLIDSPGLLDPRAQLALETDLIAAVRS
jgi:[protein-PII] uridylyltransferase